MQSDKTYMWLVVITFVGFLTGVIFGFMHLNTYKDPSVIQSSSVPFK